MSIENFEGEPHRDTGSNREKKRTGEISRSVSLTSFPIEIHRIIKEISSRGRTTSSIYSEAIISLREDLDSGEKVLLQGPPSSGPRKNTKIWISEQASNDLRYLVFHFRCFQRQGVYTAILRWINKEKEKVIPMDLPHK